MSYDANPPHPPVKIGDRTAPTPGVITHTRDGVVADAAAPIDEPIKYRTTYRNEGDVKADVKKILDHYGWTHRWMPMGGAFAANNVDFNALHHSTFLAIETKFGDNKPTVLQKRFLLETSRAGGLAFVVTEHTLRYLAAFLEAFHHAWIAGTHGEKPDERDGAMMVDVTMRLTADFRETRDAP